MEKGNLETLAVASYPSEVTEMGPFLGHMCQGGLLFVLFKRILSTAGATGTELGVWRYDVDVSLPLVIPVLLALGNFLPASLAHSSFYFLIFASSLRPPMLLV